MLTQIYTPQGRRIRKPSLDEIAMYCGLGGSKGLYVSPQGSASGISPAGVPGLQLWMDPTVSLTADQSGQGHNLTNTGGVTLGTSIGGHSTFELDGLANYWVGAALSTYVSASGWFYFCTYKDNGSPADVSLVGDAALFGDESSAAGGYLMINTSATRLRFGQSTPATTEGLVTTIAGGTVYRVIMRYDGTKIYVQVNGAGFDAGTAVGNISDLTHAMRAGLNSIGAAKYAKVSLQDWGCGNQTISNTNAASLDVWMAARAA